MVNSKETEVFKHEDAPKKRERILIIDDSPDMLNLNRTILEMRDYEVFTAKNASEALSGLENIAPLDLILLDMCMEEMSGQEFLTLLEKQMPDIVENVPIVFFSGVDSVPVSKAAGFIRKPIDISKFLAAVRHFIDVGAGHRIGT